jgi:hypothetical protein
MKKIALLALLALANPAVAQTTAVAPDAFQTDYTIYREGLTRAWDKPADSAASPRNGLVLVYPRLDEVLSERAPVVADSAAPSPVEADRAGGVTVP